MAGGKHRRAGAGEGSGRVARSQLAARRPRGLRLAAWGPFPAGAAASVGDSLLQRRVVRHVHLVPRDGRSRVQPAGRQPRAAAFDRFERGLERIARLEPIGAAGGEAAAGRHAKRVRDGALYDIQALAATGCGRDRAQQALGVRVPRRQQDLVGRARSPRPCPRTSPRAAGPSRRRRPRSWVISSSDDSGFDLQLLDQLQNLRLDRDVQRGRRLVGDHELRVAGQGHGDHHALAHAARQLVGILAARRSGAAMPTVLQQSRPPAPSPPCSRRGDGRRPPRRSGRRS